MDKHLEGTILVSFYTSNFFSTIFVCQKNLIFTISYLRNQNGTEQWYKFDDGEVSECKMHEDEEMKAQCFGGDYMGEVFFNHNVEN